MQPSVLIQVAGGIAEQVAGAAHSVSIRDMDSGEPEFSEQEIAAAEAEASRIVSAAGEAGLLREQLRGHQSDPDAKPLPAAHQERFDSLERELEGFRKREPALTASVTGAEETVRQLRAELTVCRELTQRHLADISRLQREADKVPDLTGLISEAAEALDEAIELHVYADDDKRDPNCRYMAVLLRLRAAASGAGGAT